MTKASKTEMEDRRRFERFAGEGLIANVNGKLVGVLDISFGGARLAREFTWGDPVLTLKLIPRDGRALRLNEALTVTGRVVGATEAYVRIEFDRVLYQLAKMIVAATSKSLGIDPFLVK